MLLIISRSKRLASALSESFHYMSILSYPVTPKEALSEVSVIYKAIIIIEPGSFPDIKDYITRIKELVKGIPVFAYTEQCIDELSDIFCDVFAKDTPTPMIAARIKEYADEIGLERIGRYKLAGFDASSDRVGVSYFYTRPNLTKTEAMILRYLICSYPIPQSADSILRHAFRSSRMPEASSVRTHISAINKKLDNLLNRKAISLVPKKGYFITTPEIYKNGKIM